MLKKRLTDRFELVYLHDPALANIPINMLSEYHTKGRNIADLDLKRCTEQPTIFVCEPLQIKYHYLVGDTSEAITLGVAWQIFKSHVKEARNFDDNGKPLLEWEQAGSDLLIKDECQKHVDNDVLIDIATTIIRKAGDVAVGFTLPPTFWGIRIRSQMLHAKDVGTETASETNSQ